MAVERPLSINTWQGQADGAVARGPFPKAVDGVLAWMCAEFQPAKAKVIDDQNADAYVFRVEQGSPSPTLLIAHGVFHRHSLGQILGVLERYHVAARLRSDLTTGLHCVEQEGRIVVAERQPWRRPRSAVRITTTSPREGAADPLRVVAELVEAFPDAVVVTALDRGVVVANRAAAELFGLSVEDLLRASLDDLVAPGQRLHLAERERRTLRGEAQRYDTTIVCADGRKRPVAVVATRLVLEGELIGTVAILCHSTTTNSPPGSNSCIQSSAATA